MKELYDLHDKILALGVEFDPEYPLNFSRDIVEDSMPPLPGDLRSELESIQQTINHHLPADFEYYAFLGADEPPSFAMEVEATPMGVLESVVFDPAQPFGPQLAALNWQALREESAASAKEISQLADLLDFTSRPPRTAKQIQREFREDAKAFIKEKRRDPTMIHALYWEARPDLLIERDYANGEELMKSLPAALYAGMELVTLVVGGKPLTLEKLDALTARARQAIGAIFDELDEFDEEDEEEGEGEKDDKDFENMKVVHDAGVEEAAHGEETKSPPLENSEPEQVV